MRRIGILIVNWNGWADTVACLESLFRLDYPDFRVILCDNGSTNGSLERIADWAAGRLSPSVENLPEKLQSLVAPPVVSKPLEYALYDRSSAESGGDPALDPPLVLIRGGNNLGFAGGNNIGLCYLLARGGFDAVWLLNNDTLVEPRALSALVARMQSAPSMGMCGSTLLRLESPETIQARGGGWYCRWIGLPWHLGQLQRADAPARQERVETWMNYVVGASMLVSREFLEAVGLMCEDYFLYFEELDWVLRGRGCFTLAYAPDSIVYHKVGGSIGTSSNPRHKSRVCDYYALRNRLLFTRKFFPSALPTVYLSVACAALLRLVCGRLDLASMAWRILLHGRDDAFEKRLGKIP